MFQNLMDFDDISKNIIVGSSELYHITILYRLNNLWWFYLKKGDISYH